MSGIPPIGLTLVFGNDSELHAQGVQDGIDRFEAWVCACTQGFVQALPAQACVFGDLRHASCFRHVAERGDEYIGVWVFGSRRKIFRNDRIVIEIRRSRRMVCKLFSFSSLVLPFCSSRAIFFTLAMSFVCDAFMPPASKTYTVDPFACSKRDTPLRHERASRKRLRRRVRNRRNFQMSR